MLIIHQTILRQILIFGTECLNLTQKNLEQHITTADMKVIRMIQGVTRWDRKSNEMINQNKRRRFGDVIRSEEESTVRVVMALKM